MPGFIPDESAPLDFEDAATPMAAAVARDLHRRAALRELRPVLERLYDDPDAVLDRLARVVRRAREQRPEELRELDRRREEEPGWFLDQRMLGYAAYADRFAGTLRGVGERVAHLSDLGVSYLHLMPLLQPGPEPNDGGYAVADHRAVDPRLGTLEDLADLARVLRGRGISLCVDLVLNHVAREHEWAVAARAGDADKRAWFHVHPDRTEPDRWERTLPEVFPDLAPGSFTWDDDLDGWVWTTFNSYQWDLDWSNPDVLVEFADIICFLANHGVEVFRLDAIAFLWKRLGTDCQNQPEVHDLTRVLREVARIACPAVIFKAEAIVGPRDLPAYLGVGEHAGRVSDLAYHNSLMVHLWSMLASRDVRLATHALQRIPQPPAGTGWITYARCHDDIGWAIADEDAWDLGIDPEAHRRFLSDFYSGRFPGSWARGLVFGENEQTGDRRISGSLASLAGADVGDPHAVARIRLAHALILGFGGLPVIWMGDEIGHPNDLGFIDEPGHAEDNRWVHRPRMPWSAVLDPTPVNDDLHHLVRVRRSLPHLHAAVPTEVWDPRDPGVLLVVRRHVDGPLLAAHNVTDRDAVVGADVLAWLGLDPHAVVDHLTGEAPPVHDSGDLAMAPYAVRWLTAAGA